MRHIIFILSLLITLLLTGCSETEVSPSPIPGTKTLDLRVEGLEPIYKFQYLGNWLFKTPKDGVTIIVRSDIQEQAYVRRMDLEGIKEPFIFEPFTPFTNDYITVSYGPEQDPHMKLEISALTGNANQYIHLEIGDHKTYHASIILNPKNCDEYLQ